MECRFNSVDWLVRVDWRFASMGHELKGVRFKNFLVVGGFTFGADRDFASKPE